VNARHGAAQHGRRENQDHEEQHNDQTLEHRNDGERPSVRGERVTASEAGIVDQGTVNNGETQMKFIDVLSVILVVVGALNWGLVGLVQFDLVAALLGDATGLTRLVYVVVGVAGLYHALQWKAIHFRWVGHERVTADLAGLQSTAAD
jgi:uncharacterized membrane protein YuzA (DUF378 family)